MTNIYLVGAYARKGSIYEQIRYCPRYGAFETQKDCDAQCELLNKRAIRPQTYFSVPVAIIVSKVKSGSKNASNGSTTRGKRKKV